MENRIAAWLRGHLANLRCWTELPSGRMFDPFESHRHDADVPAESHAPATALSACCAAADVGIERPTDLISAYAARCATLFASGEGPPEVRLLVQFFGLAAAADLTAASDKVAQAGSQLDHLISTLAAEPAVPEAPDEPALAAAAVAAELMRLTVADEADRQLLNDALERLASAQTETGFLAGRAGASFSSAGHMLSLYILGSAVCRTTASNQSEPVRQVCDRAAGIIARGYWWLGQMLANDGMFAQFGRGMYRLAAQAAGAALLAAAQIPHDDPCTWRYLNWMARHRTRPDETACAADIFSVTPNLCPPALRAGYEPHAAVVPENCLALAALLDAYRWWKNLLRPLPNAAEARKAFFEAARSHGLYVDEATGLARFRGRAGYCLLLLEAAQQTATPTAVPVHLRLGDDLHEKAEPPVFWPEPRIAGNGPDAVLETAALKPASAAQQSAIIIGPSQPAQCQASASLLRLSGTADQTEWTKLVLIEPNALTLDWSLTARVSGRVVSAVIPCLLWDGRHTTSLRFDGPEVSATAAGRTWRLKITDHKNKPLKGTWKLHAKRSTLSVSGLVGWLEFPVGKTTRTGRTLHWRIRIERL